MTPACELFARWLMRTSGLGLGLSLWAVLTSKIPDPLIPIMEIPWFAIDVSKLCFWLPLPVVGYVYVNVGFWSEYEPYTRQFSNDNIQPFLKMMVISCYLYFMGPSQAVASTADESRQSTTKAEVPVEITRTMSAATYNVLFYVIPYIIGLNFTYLQMVPFLNEAIGSITFDRNRDPRCPQLVEDFPFWSKQLFIAAIAMAIVVIFLCLVYINVRKHTWKRLVLYGLFVSSYLLLNWFFRREREYLQIHHWFWALILIPLTMVQHPIASATQAFLLGIFVEGVASWGVESIWVPKPPRLAEAIIASDGFDGSALPKLPEWLCN